TDQDLVRFHPGRSLARQLGNRLQCAGNRYERLVADGVAWACLCIRLRRRMDGRWLDSRYLGQLAVRRTALASSHGAAQQRADVAGLFRVSLRRYASAVADDLRALHSDLLHFLHELRVRRIGPAVPDAVRNG